MLLQFYIFYIGRITDIGVNESDLVLSICISCFVFVYNLYKLKRESHFHGMPFAEYALSVLQLGTLIYIYIFYFF